MYKNLIYYYKIIILFFKEIKEELNQITYPSYKESIYFSFLVIILVSLISFIIWILDNILIYLFSFIIKIK